MNAQAFQLLDAEFARQFRTLATPTVVKPLTESDITRMDAYDAGVDAYVAENLQARIQRNWHDDECVQRAWDDMVCPKPTRGWRNIVAALRAGDTAEAGRLLHVEMSVGIEVRADECLRDEFAP